MRTTLSVLQSILSIVFYQQKVSKTEILKPIVESTNEIYQQDLFLSKIIVWNCFAKPAITES